jgi:hypothetical protein
MQAVVNAAQQRGARAQRLFWARFAAFIVAA